LDVHAPDAVTQGEYVEVLSGQMYGEYVEVLAGQTYGEYDVDGRIRLPITLGELNGVVVPPNKKRLN
jgi:hypothetical protein